MKKLVGCIGSAADIIEFVSEAVLNQPKQSCNSKLHLILCLCCSLILGCSQRMNNLAIFTINQSKAYFNSYFYSYLMAVVLELKFQ